MGCKAPRDRHCEREDVPKTAMPLGRKSAIAGKLPCEKVGYVRGRELFQSASQETCMMLKSIVCRKRKRYAIAFRAGRTRQTGGFSVCADTNWAKYRFLSEMGHFCISSSWGDRWFLSKEIGGFLRLTPVSGVIIVQAPFAVHSLRQAEDIERMTLGKPPRSPLHTPSPRRRSPTHKAGKLPQMRKQSDNINGSCYSPWKDSKACLSKRFF